MKRTKKRLSLVFAALDDGVGVSVGTAGVSFSSVSVALDGGVGVGTAGVSFSSVSVALDGVGVGAGGDSFSLKSLMLHVKGPHRGNYVGADFCKLSASFITTDIPSS